MQQQQQQPQPALLCCHCRQDISGSLPALDQFTPQVTQAVLGQHCRSLSRRWRQEEQRPLAAFGPSLFGIYFKLCTKKKDKARRFDLQFHVVHGGEKARPCTRHTLCSCMVYPRKTNHKTGSDPGLRAVKVGSCSAAGCSVKFKPYTDEHEPNLRLRRIAVLQHEGQNGHSVDLGVRMRMVPFLYTSPQPFTTYLFPEHGGECKASQDGRHSVAVGDATQWCEPPSSEEDEDEDEDEDDDDDDDGEDEDGSQDEADDDADDDSSSRQGADDADSTIDGAAQPAALSTVSCTFLPSLSCSSMDMDFVDSQPAAGSDLPSASTGAYYTPPGLHSLQSGLSPNHLSRSMGDTGFQHGAGLQAVQSGDSYSFQPQFSFSRSSGSEPGDGQPDPVPALLNGGHHRHQAAVPSQAPPDHLQRSMSGHYPASVPSLDASLPLSSSMPASSSQREDRQQHSWESVVGRSTSRAGGPHTVQGAAHNVVYSSHPAPPSAPPRGGIDGSLPGLDCPPSPYAPPTATPPASAAFHSPPSAMRAAPPAAPHSTCFGPSCHCYPLQQANAAYQQALRQMATVRQHELDMIYTLLCQSGEFAASAD